MSRKVFCYCFVCLFYFLLIFVNFPLWINLTHPPSLHFCPPPLQTPSLPHRKITVSETSLWKLWYSTVCYTIHHFAQAALLARSHLFVSGPMASPSILDPQPDPSWLSYYWPVSWRFCSFGSTEPAPSCAPTIRRRGGSWGGPTLSSGSWPRVEAELASLAALLCPCH